MLDVPRIISVLIAKITAHPKMIEFKIIFIFRIVERPHPKMYIIEIMPIENNERNIDCFIFILRPFRELTQGWVIAPLMMELKPNIKNPAVPPYNKSNPLLFPKVGSIKKLMEPIIKLKNTIVNKEIFVLGSVRMYLERPITLSVLDICLPLIKNLKL
jgi:hypothetical protein